MGQTDILWFRQYNFYPSSLCCGEKPLETPSGALHTEKSFKCKTICLSETLRVCNGTITGLPLHPNVTLTSPQVLYS